MRHHFPYSRPMQTRLFSLRFAPLALLTVSTLATVSCGGDKIAPVTPSTPPTNASDVVSASDRAPDDVALDAGRKPSELLAFLGIKPGMHVAELGAGGGYTAELLARAVGPEGVVIGQNSKVLLEKFAEGPWSARLRKPVMHNVQRVDREFDEPLPSDRQDLDVVLINLFYHDTVWLKTDRAKMNASVFRALKKGGTYVVADHSGRPGTGVTEAQTLHRIEESVVRQEVSAAGFAFVEEANFLRNAGDTRDWNASPKSAGERRGQSDRFVLKFKKP